MNVSTRRNFSDIDYDEALRRAHALVPLLKEHAAEGEAATKVAPRVMQALHEAGLLRYLQPKRWGGMELPFVAMVAVARRPKPAIFCLIVFVVGLVLMSFGGMKDRRYISFILPFLFVLWGIALAEAWPFLRRCVAMTSRRALNRLLPGSASPAAAWTLLTLSVLFVVAANGASMRTLFQLAGLNVVADGGGAGVRESRQIADWAAVRPALGATSATRAATSSTRTT